MTEAARRAATELLRRRAREDLLAFMAWTWQGAGPFLVGRHTRAICARLTRAVADWERGVSTQLVLSVPFRHGKSEIAKAFQAFFLGRCAAAQPSVLEACYNAELAVDFSKAVRDLVRSEAYQALFPGVLPRPVVEHGAVFLANEHFGIFADKPHRRGGGGCTHHNLKVILGSKSHRAVEPPKVIDALLGFKLSPGKLGKVGELEAKVVHALQVALPLALVPVLRVIVGPCEGEILLIEPSGAGLRRARTQRCHNGNSCQCFLYHTIILCLFQVLQN